MSSTKRSSGSSKQPPDVNYRSASTGRYVKEHYAKTHPDSTVKERDRKK